MIEASKILHRVHDEESKPFEIEMSWVCDESDKTFQRVRERKRGWKRGSEGMFRWSKWEGRNVEGVVRDG